MTDSEIIQAVVDELRAGSVDFSAVRIGMARQEGETDADYRARLAGCFVMASSGDVFGHVSLGDIASAGTPSVLFGKTESQTVLGQGQTVIPVGQDVRETDILFVDIDGVTMAEGADYERDGNTIVLAEALPEAGMVVHFQKLRAGAVPVYDYALLKGDKGDSAEVEELAPGTVASLWDYLMTQEE